MDIGIKIGNELTKAAMEPMADAIIRIMEVRADQKTIREGLRAFGRVAEVKNVSLHDITINGGIGPSRDGKTPPAWTADLTPPAWTADLTSAPWLPDAVTNPEPDEPTDPDAE